MTDTQDTTQETGDPSRARAFAKFIVETYGDSADLDEISETTYSETSFEYGNEEYRVLTDEEADEAVKSEIRELVWAFNPEFISGHTKHGLSTDAQKSLKLAQEKLCEGANDLVLNLIEDFDHFVDDAVSTDGRGHFLSGYDGDENEVELDGTYYFIYRTN